MVLPRTERVRIESEENVLQARTAARIMARDLGFSLVLQTKASTAASELARNALEYGGGGEAVIEVARFVSGPGLRMTFADEGPGIADIEQALRDGFTTTRGKLGLGLGGARRLSNEFRITSEPGRGTTVSIAIWP
jgi:serine/threonine-protein kinase RsbT